MSDEVKVKFVADTTGLQDVKVPGTVPVTPGTTPTPSPGSVPPTVPGPTPKPPAPTPAPTPTPGQPTPTPRPPAPVPPPNPAPPRPQPPAPPPPPPPPSPGGGGGGGGGRARFPWEKGWGDEFKKDMSSNFASMLSGANIATFLGEQFVNAVKNGAEYAQKVDKFSRITGLSTTDVQRYGYAAQMTGVSMEQFISSVAAGNKELGKMALEGGANTATFRRLGISIEGVRTHTVSSMDVIKKMADHYKNYGESVELARLGTQLFGDQYKNLIPLLKGGSAEIEKLANNAPVVNPLTINASSASAKVGSQSWDAFTAGGAGWLTGFSAQMRGTAERIFMDREWDTNPNNAAQTSSNKIMRPFNQSGGRAFRNILGFVIPGFRETTYEDEGLKMPGMGKKEMRTMLQTLGVDDVMPIRGIPTYEVIKAREQFRDRRTAVIEQLDKEIAEEEKNKKPDFSTGIFQAASSLQAIGGGDVLSAINRVNPLDEIKDATVRTAVATEKIAAGAGGGANNTPPPADTNGPVAK